MDEEVVMQVQDLVEELMDYIPFLLHYQVLHLLDHHLLHHFFLWH